MAISRGNIGYGELVSGLAQKAGEAVAARRAAEIAAQLQARREEQQSRMQIAQMENQFQTAKMQLGYQMELEREARAQSWEIDKMELRSKLDFEEEEKKLRMKKQEFELKKKAIQESDMITDAQKNQLLTALELEEVGAETTAASFLRPKTIEQIAAERMGIGAKKKEVAPTTVNTGPGQTQKPFVDVIETPQGVQYIDPVTNEFKGLEPDKMYSFVKPDGKSYVARGSQLLQINPETGNQVWQDVQIKGEKIESQFTQLPEGQQKVQRSFQKAFLGKEDVFTLPTQELEFQSTGGFGGGYVPKDIKKKQQIIKEETDRQYQEWLAGKPKFRYGQGRVNPFVVDKNKLNQKLKEAGL